MKRGIVFTLLFSSVLFILVACLNSSDPTAEGNNAPPPPPPPEVTWDASEDPLGTVLYSVLSETQFQELRGPGWILMDGRNITESDLATLTGMANAPDGRGVFFRMKNHARNTSTGDESGERPIGDYQEDMFRSHSHNYRDRYTIDNGPDDGGSSRRDKSNFDIVRNSENTGGDETRPRNIALNTFIKINN